VEAAGDRGEPARRRRHRGTEYVANATDGHTLLLGTQSSILPKFTQKSLRFDPLTDLVPVY